MGNVYVVHGSNELFARDFIREKTTKRVYYDQTSDIRTVAESLLQGSLFAEPATPILINLLSNTTPEDIAAMVESGKDVFFWESELTAGAKKISKDLTVANFPALKEGEVKNWIKTEAQKQSLNVSREVLDRLYFLFGSNLLIIRNELARLKLTLGEKLGDGTSISVEDLSESKTVEANLFNIQDAVGERRSKLFNKEISAVYNQIDEWYIFALIVNHVRKLLQTKSGMTVNAHPFVQKKLGQQAKNWTEDELTEQLNLLLDIEFQAKKGEVNVFPAIVAWFMQKVARDVT